jgi:cell wall-associated NlpC family hydrolase
MTGIDDVMSRISQLQQLVTAVAPQTAGSGDFSSLLAQVSTDGSATGSSADDGATSTGPVGAYGTTPTGTPVLGSTAVGTSLGSSAAAVFAASASGTTAGTADTATTAATATTATTATGATATGATGAVTGGDIVSDATKYLGVPYQWGGTDPSTGLDCSGLVQRVFGDEGVSLPRTSAEQATVGTEVPGGLANAQPGDLVFFGSPVHHVGIYAGNGTMVEAPHTGTKVQVHSIDDTPTHVRRIALPTGASGATAVSGSTYASTAGTATAALSAMAAEDPTAAMDALGVPQSLRPVLTSAAQTQGLPVSLLAAVAKVESGFDTTSVSSAGAQGLMQLMPDTAAGLGANPWDPQSAANGAAKLLRGYLDKYDSVPVALAAYNAGPGAVSKYGGVPPYAETQAYVQRVGQLAAAA